MCSTIQRRSSSSPATPPTPLSSRPWAPASSTGSSRSLPSSQSIYGAAVTSSSSRFPFLSLFLFWTGFSFWAKGNTLKVGMVTTGMYLFEVFYSPGEGPVPFTYSAEAFPVHVRDVGMSWATATTWCFNFILSFSWPHLLRAFKPQGAFGWYAAWCLILWVLILLFVPETKVSLDLDDRGDDVLTILNRH